MESFQKHLRILCIILSRDWILMHYYITKYIKILSAQFLKLSTKLHGVIRSVYAHVCDA